MRIGQGYDVHKLVEGRDLILCGVNVPYETVDVNVHPAKTQVRFSDEKRVFTAVYNAVKNAILSGDTRPEISVTPQKKNTFLHMTAEEYRQTAVKLPVQEKQDTARETVKPKKEFTRLESEKTPFFLHRVSISIELKQSCFTQ